MVIILTALAILPSSLPQIIELQNLNNNNGYVTIKLDDVKTIRNFKKILHVINITEYEDARDIIQNNLKTLEGKDKPLTPMYNTLVNNFNLLQRKIDSLKPHTRQRRGLINILGTGLKYLAGTMDHNDEEEIKNQLDALSKNNRNLIEESNKQILINNEISDEIKNLTQHIKTQQTNISKYLNDFTKLYEKILKRDGELEYIQQVYQINYDINLLKNHIDDIEQIILTSKLGILSKNILTEKELIFIDDIENFKDIKIVVAFHIEQIVIILLIPEYSEKAFSKILIEPLPNSMNKSIFLNENTILVDHNNTVYSSNVKDKLTKNLIPIEDKCIQNIINFNEAYCIMQKFDKEVIKEILPGIIITKNVAKTSISQNCNNLKINIFGNFLIKHENCKIKINKILYENYFTKLQDNIVLPHFITKIVSNITISRIELEEIHINNIKNNREKITEILSKKHESYIINTSINIFIIIIALSLICIIKKCISKKQNKIIINASSEPQTNGGGVMFDTNKSII